MHQYRQRKRVDRLPDAGEPLIGEGSLVDVGEHHHADRAVAVRALELFLDGFRENRSGSRLIDLAVPLPLAAQQTETRPTARVAATTR